MNTKKILWIFILFIGFVGKTFAFTNYRIGTNSCPSGYHQASQSEAFNFARYLNDEYELACGDDGWGNDCFKLTDGVMKSDEGPCSVTFNYCGYTPSRWFCLPGSPTNYTVTFNTQGGNSISSQTKASGTSITLPTPTRNGYTFKGWCKNGTTCSSPKSAGTSETVSANVTYYAQWAQNYTVTFDTQGGDSIASRSIEGGTTTLLPTPTRGGYTFKGWCKNGTTCSSPISAGTSETITADVIYYALYDWNTATWYQDADGSTVTYNGISYTLLNRNSSPGLYKWGGTTTSSSASNDVNARGGGADSDVNGYNDPTLSSYVASSYNSLRQGPCPGGFHIPSRGEWSALIVARCHLPSNNCTENSLEYDDGKLIAITEGADVLAENFDLDSSKAYWSSSRNNSYIGRTTYVSTVDIYVDDAADVSGNLPVRCISVDFVSQPTTYTVTYKATTNGGNTADQTATVSAGQSVDLTKTATKNGYTFVGWNTNSTATTPLTAYSMPANNVTLYAIFKKTVNVTFSKGNGVYSITQPSSTSCTAWNTATTCSVSAATATCNAGYRSPAWSESTNNLSGNITTTASCTVCDAGTYTEAGNTATSCTQCEAGYYCPAGSAKAQCTGRTEYSAVGVSECSTVSAGYYTTGCDGDGNKCTGQSQCTAGTACSGGVKTSCVASTSTTAGTYSASAGATSCTTASDGYYVESANATTQTQCPAGSYCQGGMKNSCPTGYTSNTGATAQNQCYIEVSAGNYLGTANGTTTTSCAAGTYKGAHNVNYGSTSSCDDCTAGNYCPAGSSTQTACTTLGSNYTHSAANSTSASACYMDVLAGSYKTSVNGNETAGCGAGKWSAAHTSYYGSADNSCSNIEAGCYGSSATSACPAQCEASTDAVAGSYSSEGANACTPATDGNYVTTAKATTETLCPAGSYCPGGKIISCTTLGTDYTSDAGASTQNGCYKVLTATFNENGATSVSSGSVTCKLYNGSSTCNITSPTITSASGFEPLGFNTDNTAETSILAVNTLTGITTDITYYAITKSTSPIKVTFDVNGNGGSTSTGECYRYNGSGSCSITAPTIISAAEFTVIGWNSNKDTHTNEWTGGDSRTVSADATYYAQSSKAGYQVTASYNIGTGVSEIGATSGHCDVDMVYNGSGYSPCNITLPTITLKVGYGTGKWTTGTIEVSPSETISLTGDDTYTASATPNTYSVKFDAGEGTGTMSNQEFTYDVTGSLTANAFTRTGYTFSGWIYGTTGYTDGQEVSNLTTTNNDIITFIAQWTPITYSVEFTGTDVSGTMANQEFTYDATQTLTANVFTKTGYTFSGWTDGTTGYADKQNVNNLTTTDGATVTLTAQWTPITYTVSFSGNAADATGTAPATINAEYDSGDIAPDNSFTLTGYTFTGWNTESDGSGTGYATGDTLKNLTIRSGANVELYAQWEVNVHKLNFVVDGTTIQSGNVAYAAAISAPAEPKKDCNSFAGWTSSVEGLTTTGTMPDSDVTFTANWNYTCSRSSGGGGGRTPAKSDTHGSAETGTVATGTGETNVKSDTQDKEKQEDGDKGESQKYSEEFENAYEFAYKHGITTMDSIEKADMEGPLTRIAMAKMLSYYAINVLGLKPDETRVNKFNDVSDQMDAEYNNAVSLAYQLGIMGINMPKNRFRPNDLVTRAEFATALSRMLYKIADGKDVYYSTHMAKLMEEKIITNDNPDLQELRGYVMIMLMRSAK